MLCNAYDDMLGFSILNTQGVTPAIQRNPELGGSKGDLRGELLGHIQAPWEPMGRQELPSEGW